MGRVFLMFLFFLFAINMPAQNVGIGLTNPTERLDVAGNINVAGTIKVNGVDGSPNQVLMKNGNGTFGWGDLCEFKNYVTFNYSSSGGAQNWTVPTGVTKIRVELWGGGGSASGTTGDPESGCGGGSGGYITGYFSVPEGTAVSITVGSGANLSVPNAEMTRVDVIGKSLIALGGGNSIVNSSTNSVSPGNGGTTIAFGTVNYISIWGASGEPSVIRFDQVSTTTFAKSISYGKGGDAPLRPNTGGKGGYRMVNTSSGALLSNTTGSNGMSPGGGSAADSYAGGNGLVIIYY